MKKYIFIITLASIVTACTNQLVKPFEQSKGIHTQAEIVSNNVLIIFYDQRVGKQPLIKAIQRYQAETVYEYENMNGFAIRIPKGKNIEHAEAFFKEVEGVLSVERDQIMQLH
ncbi:MULTISPECIES: hypothetical protein [Glaesserella]|uniref:Inhibitor I9 domain-containing protein n=1 Tax=Glaesserella australis TaxID=2094024 RepID=A0A328C4J8_9PAST|nr:MULTISPECIES: hypothetical protein [Glaesserella]AUI66332.1 hypothetical protein CJD39_06905 [Glaesserella sp. 15-184]RAL19454.1 hypothetical protein C5N92_03160 [Glaesserella australis]